MEITQPGGGGGGSGTTLHTEIPTGTIDDTNVSFTVLHIPLYIVVNGAAYLVGQGMYSSFGGGIITLTAPVGVGGFITSFYNA